MTLIFRLPSAISFIISTCRVLLVMCTLLPVVHPAAGQSAMPLREVPGVFSLAIPAYDTSAISRMIRKAEVLARENRDSAVSLFREAARKSRESGYLEGYASALCNLGKIYTLENRYDQAQEAFLMSLRVAVRVENNKDLLPFIYGNISWMYALQGKYEISAQYLFHLAAYAEKELPLQQRASVYINIGGILASLPEPYQSASRKQALYYCDLAEQYARRSENGDMLSTALLNKGDLYVRDRNWEQSKFYLDSALILSRKLGIRETQHNVLVTLGEMYVARSMPERALQYLVRAQALQPHVNPYYQIPEVFNLGLVYLQLKRYDLAEEVLVRAMQIRDNMGLCRPEIDEALSRVYLGTGQYQQSLFHFQRYIHTRDSLISKQTTENIYSLETQYRTAQKDKALAEKQLQINLQQRELEQKNIWIAGATLGTLILTFLLIVLYRNYRHRQKFQRARILNLQQQQEILHKETEIERLKAMMTGEEKERTRLAQELHDGIGGMLAAINMHFHAAKRSYNRFEGMPDLEQIMQMLEETTDEVRKTAHNLMPGILMKQNLSEALQAYCDQVGMNNRLHIDLHLEEMTVQLEKSVELVLFRIIQELIQNIIKHAHATHAIIEIGAYRDSLKIAVEDNGIGFNKNGVRSGLGLQNLQFRVKTLGGILAVESKPNIGTTVHIELSLSMLGQPGNLSIPENGGKIQEL